MGKKTIFIDLQNQNRRDPRDAMVPFPKDSTPARILDYVRDSFPDYRADDLVGHSRRMFLHWQGYAPKPGKGSTELDRGAAAGLANMWPYLEPTDVVLLGERVAKAFEPITGKIETMRCRTVTHRGAIVRVWKVPSPSGRNYWYTDEENMRQFAKLVHTITTEEKTHEGT